MPIKSACFLSGAAKTDEIASLPDWCLRLIVLVEARAAPRLRTIEGLWRSSTRTRPGSMTQLIRDRQLLAPSDIDAVIADAPRDLIRFQDFAANIGVEDPTSVKQWIDRFSASATGRAA